MSILQSTTIHGVFMSVFEVGTLVLGKSGIGKSDLALSLIDRGHALIADDMVEFSVTDKNLLLGCSPKLLKNFLEIRGLGIIDVAAFFGAQAVVKEKELSLVIQLEKPASLPHEIAFNDHSWSLLEVVVPSFYLPLSEGRPCEVLLETLVRKHQFIQKKGYDPNKDFLENHHKALSVLA